MKTIRTTGWSSYSGTRAKRGSLRSSSEAFCIKMIKRETQPNRGRNFYFIATSVLFLGIAVIEAGVSHRYKMAGIILLIAMIAIPLGYFRGRLMVKSLCDRNK